MEKLQQEIWELSQQVKQLHQAMEDLPLRLIDAMTRQSSSRQSSASDIAKLEDVYCLEHKDVLVDKSQPSWSSHIDDREISSDWQIRRLTAQLTTAYNRIAALEEELLNRRMSTR